MLEAIEYDLNEVLKEVNRIIVNCENIQGKFKVGSSQHTLLVNRIKALMIGKQCIENELLIQTCVIEYTKKELEDALTPIESILHKCHTAQNKYELGTKQYKRFEPLIQSMLVCKTLIKTRI